MKIQDLLKLYAKSPQVGALAETLRKKSVKNIFLEGLMCSSAPMLFGALKARFSTVVLFILQDADEAGYFYHDLVQLSGEGEVLFFPSSYRRAVKYGQRDAASEILRTEVLSRLTTIVPDAQTLVIVTSAEPLAEKVVSKSSLEDKSIQVHPGETLDREELHNLLLELGFNRGE